MKKKKQIDKVKVDDTWVLDKDVKVYQHGSTTVYEDDNVRIEVTTDLDYSCCWYESDTPDIETHAYIYKKKDVR